MKIIEINKGGFGLATLFIKESTKDVLIEPNREQLMSGYYLEELEISYRIGDEIHIKSPSIIGGNVIHRIRVYNVTDKLYECEFIPVDFSKL